MVLLLLLECVMGIEVLHVLLLVRYSVFDEGLRGLVMLLVV